MEFDLIVIGGGAAGFFGAIQAAEIKPGLSILILEKSNKVLSKVRVSGGGRCNVTFSEFNPFELSHHYPRGEKALKSLFKIFHAEHTVKWFAAKGVTLNAESDGRMFPSTNSSQEIISCFMTVAQRLNIQIQMGKQVIRIQPETKGFTITCADGTVYETKKILIATGGHSNRQAYDFISALSHNVKNPIPSLFTFNDAEKNFKDLMGVSVDNVEVKIAGTKFLRKGSVLITHWGLSGPAVIKLSAWAAEYLHAVEYKFTVLVNWLGDTKEEALRNILTNYKTVKAKQRVMSSGLFHLPQRLGHRLCRLAEIDESKTWAELSKKELNKLLEYLLRCPFKIAGKTTFKDEFVTCGGVDLQDVDVQTMESKRIKNLFFAGEVLDVDGETGGFNFQNAWTTAFIAAKAIACRD